MDMRDPNFTFTRQAEERRRRLEPPPRTRKPGQELWKVTGAGAPRPPRWKVEPLDPERGTSHFVEIGRPPRPGGGFHFEKHHRSRFRMVITTACAVAGQHAEPGSTVECWHHAAADLLSSGCARILEEIRNG